MVELSFSFVRTEHTYMAISKAKKSEVIAKVKDALSEASSVAFVGFTKLSVADASKLRKTLAEEGVKFYVAKKTLMKRAFAEQGYEGEIPDLPGEVAIAWTAEDATAPARGVHQFGKKLKNTLTLLGGVFEGAYADAAKITAVATIPPVPVLRGMFVNVVASPMQGLVIALDKVREQKEA